MAISTALRVLLDHVVDSYDKLRLVVDLLQVTDRRAQVASVAKKLDLSVEEIRKLADAMSRTGLIVRLDGESLSLPAQSVAIEAALKELAYLYDHDVGVIATALAGTAIGRVRDLLVLIQRSNVEAPPTDEQFNDASFCSAISTASRERA